MPGQLDVYLFEHLVGHLAQVNGRLNFRYTPDWLAHSGARALSHSLPLQATPFDDHATRPFFAGLLPEGDKRKLVAQALQVSRQNDFGLLDGIGGECAGAVTLMEPGQALPALQNPPAVRWLDDGQLLRLLDEMPQRPMLAGEDGLRLSLAGAQDKLPVLADGKRIGLPLLGTPSTHIIKPLIAGIDGSVHNEGFCMALARAMGLDVAPASVRQIEGRPYLLVTRYDRVPGTAADTTPTRLHQEDFCQALGVPPETKYQNEGGPGLPDAFALLRSTTRPSALHVLKLLDAVVFNALVGNHDAHAKNFSLLHTARGTVLAPLYDLLCTAAYPRLTDKMAMKIGSKYKFSEVQTRHWTQFAEAAGLSPALVKKRILEMADRLPTLARTTLAAMELQGNGHAVLGEIVGLVGQRCGLTVRRLGEGST
ncbi:MAG: type II toxin-antitoxin system HipA family toxin [Rhodoferax sp.]|uniref:type II toxin-antitoxin system HipA family toxin n=1 Tax=Rhodoferax sp. TaxID=50421 RepID=UPI0032637DDD